MIVESGGGDFTDAMKIKNGIHKGKIVDVKVTSPEEDMYKAWSYRLKIEMPQFTEEGKDPPALFYNFPVMSPKKNKDGSDGDGSEGYNLTVFPGSTSKAAKALQAVGIEIKEGLELLPELFLEKDVAVGVEPHVKKDGTKTKKVGKLYHVSEAEEDSAPVSTSTDTEEELYAKIVEFKGTKKEADELIKIKSEAYDGMVSKAGLYRLILKDLQA